MNEQADQRVALIVNAAADAIRRMRDGDYEPSCEVYWGSHGCDLRRGHDPSLPHMCLTCLNGLNPSDDEPWDDLEGYVGLPPYYGPETLFYGKDAANPR